MERLPDDVLAEVLRRGAPRSLAASRCVCRAWRALIDGRGMLRADLLPRTLAGLVLSYESNENERYAKLFARPPVDLNDYDMPNTQVLDHCNGLLLLYSWVYNPATGGHATLPERPAAPRDGTRYLLNDAFLAFDPTVSPRYEVFLIPSVLCKRRHPRVADSALLHPDLEWPPSPFVLSVFSSATGLWEERSFSREGEPAGTVADVQLEWFEPDRHAEYWRGTLYVHYQTDFVMRISSSNSTYRVIKLPKRGTEASKHPEYRIGRSQKGIYCALLDNYRLSVWILDESCDRIEWRLRHDSGQRRLAFPNLSCDHGPWVWTNDYAGSGEEDDASDDDESEDEDEDEAQAEEEFEWNSDDDSILPAHDMVEKCAIFNQILAFHPYKEIVFFVRSSKVLAYHLSSSKLEELGNLVPSSFCYFENMMTSFPYTPCWMGELPQTFE